MKLIHRRNIHNITTWDFETTDLKIGWKDKDLYYFVTDKVMFTTQSTWDINFIFSIQNKGNTGWHIIYEVIDYIEKSLSGLLEPDIKETVLGSAEIKKIFKVSNAGKVAGSKVISGEIKSKSKARIIRDGVVVYNGEILSIFREKNQVKEVSTGLECGISLKDFIDFKEKDVIESYLSEKIQRTI